MSEDVFIVSLFVVLGFTLIFLVVCPCIIDYLDHNKKYSARKARMELKKREKKLIKEDIDEIFDKITICVQKGRDHVELSSYVKPEVITILKKRGYDVNQQEGVTTISWRK